RWQSCTRSDQSSGSSGLGGAASKKVPIKAAGEAEASTSAAGAVDVAGGVNCKPIANGRSRKPRNRDHSTGWRDRLKRPISSSFRNRADSTRRARSDYESAALTD